MRSCDKVKGPALTGCKVVIAGCAMLRGRLEARPQQEGLALLTQHYVLCHCLSNLQCRLESWHQVSSPMSHPQVLRSGGPTALTFQKARKPLLSSRELSLLPTNCPLPLITPTLLLTTEGSPHPPRRRSHRHTKPHGSVAPPRKGRQGQEDAGCWTGWPPQHDPCSSHGSLPPPGWTPGPWGLLSELTWILPWTPVLSIRLATLTVFPQMSYCGLRAPITPATTGPTLMPGKQPRRGVSTEASEGRSCPS